MHQSINAIKETYWCSLGDGVGPLPTPFSLCRSISKSIVHTKFIAIHNFVSCTIDCSEFCTIKWTIYKSYFQIWIPTAEPLVSASAIPRTEQRALTSSVLTTAPYQSHHLLLTPSSMPTSLPNIAPSVIPNDLPSVLPSVEPVNPSSIPSSIQLSIPSTKPSSEPSKYTCTPSSIPNTIPSSKPKCKIQGYLYDWFDRRYEYTCVKNNAIPFISWVYVYTYTWLVDSKKYY